MHTHTHLKRKIVSQPRGRFSFLQTNQIGSWSAVLGTLNREVIYLPASSKKAGLAHFTTTSNEIDFSSVLSTSLDSNQRHKSGI